MSAMKKKAATKKRAAKKAATDALRQLMQKPDKTSAGIGKPKQSQDSSPKRR